jgi:hypothetical protein
MENKIRVEYYFNNELYRLNGDYFNVSQVRSYTDSIQKEYELFADKINAEGGYLEIHLAHPEPSGSVISFDTRLKNVSDALRKELYEALGY